MRTWQPGNKEAFELSILSLVASFVAVVMGAVTSVQTSSATALGYTLENSVDFAGSILVLWRFAGGGSYESKQTLENREQRADVGISGMFVLLGITIFLDAVRNIWFNHEDKDVIELIALYSPSLVVFLVLGVAKIHVGRSVRSQSLQKDGTCSLAGALLSAGVLLSAIVQKYTDVWWLDSFIAIIVAIGLAAKGLSALHHFARSGTRFWSTTFWSGHSVCLRPMDEHPLLVSHKSSSSSSS